MLTGSLHSYCTQLVRLPVTCSAHRAYRAWVRSNEFSGVNPSFNEEIRFSLVITMLVGTATRAMLRALWGACANALDPESKPRTAVPPTPTRNSRRLGSRVSRYLARLAEILDLFSLFMFDFPLQRLLIGAHQWSPRKRLLTLESLHLRCTAVMRNGPGI